MTETTAPATGWQDATVLGFHDETARVRTFRLALSRPVVHLAGQHYVVRLTAPDGYTASRSYSVASAPDDSGEIELTVERLDDGEVSSFLHDVVEPGDVLELRGPIGGWFVWDATHPALLVAGGIGVVPVMAMLRHARRLDRRDLLQVVVSARAPDDLLYPGELDGPEVSVIYTRTSPDGHPRRPARLTGRDLPMVRAGVVAYVCGSPDFADHATDLLTASGLPASRIRVERFGPSGPPSAVEVPPGTRRALGE